MTSGIVPVGPTPFRCKSRVSSGRGESNPHNVPVATRFPFLYDLQGKSAPRAANAGAMDTRRKPG